MTYKRQTGVLILIIFAATSGLCFGQGTIWNGPDTLFRKTNNTDWTLEVNQDRITSNVWLTRKSTRGIFNIKTENAYVSTSPDDTEWSDGTTDDIAGLTFTSWFNWHDKNPPGKVNVNAVLHLIKENIYIDIKFTSWSIGSGGGGGFSYIRSTAPVGVQTPGLISPVDGSEGIVRGCS